MQSAKSLIFRTYNERKTVRVYLQERYIRAEAYLWHTLK